MMNIRKGSAAIAITLALAALFSGCSTANPESALNLVDGTGKHVDGWVGGHGSYALPDGSLCIPCHGDNLDGGIAGVSCSTASYNGQGCHANGPGLHTAGWLDKSAPDFHALAYSPADNSCSLCHDPAQPDSPPGYNCLDCHFSEDGTQRVPSGNGYAHGSTAQAHKGFSGSEAQVCVNCHTVNIGYGNQASCHNCHDAHEKPYLNHYEVAPTATIFSAECASCHNITGSSGSGAPACTSCHTQGSPYTQTNCRSCHGRPPSTGKHGDHGSTCSNCHQGAGTGTGLNHFYDDQVDVVFSVSNFTYSGGRCNGTCHDEGHTNRNWN